MNRLVKRVMNAISVLFGSRINTHISHVSYVVVKRRDIRDVNAVSA